MDEVSKQRWEFLTEAAEDNTESSETTVRELAELRELAGLDIEAFLAACYGHVYSHTVSHCLVGHVYSHTVIDTVSHCTVVFILWFCCIPSLPKITLHNLHSDTLYCTLHTFYCTNHTFYCSLACLL